MSCQNTIFVCEIREKLPEGKSKDLGSAFRGALCHIISSRPFVRCYKYDKKRWDEMRWEEMRRDEMRWDEKRWDEIGEDGIW